MATDYVTVVVESVPSTQDVAIAEYERASVPALVVSGSQTEGRGRLGRTWWQADRALFSSLAFRSWWPPERRSLITLVAGLSVRRSILRHTGVAVGLRWPNDLVIPDGKLGGILTEAAADRVAVGCGLNLWWPQPGEGAAGLLDDDPGPDLAEVLARSWAEDLLVRVGRSPDDWNRDEYLAACVTIGATVSYRTGTGTAVDVAPDGALRVETADGVVDVASGEVRAGAATTLPPAGERERRSAGGGQE